MLDPIGFHARTTPEKRALLDLQTGESISYRVFDERVGRIAGLLRDRLAGKRGERVVVISRNSAFMMILHYACARAGAVFVPLNWRLAPPEIAALLEDAQPEVLIWQSEFDALAEPGFAMTAADRRFRLEDDGASMLAAAADFSPIKRSVEKSENDPITLLYTSGTSGRAKGVILTERTVLYSALNYGLSVNVSSASVSLCDMPLFHVAGLLAVARTSLFYGGSVVIAQKFDPAETYKNLCDETLGITHYFCVTQMAARMRAAHEPGAMKRLSHLTVLQTGGAPNPPASVREWVADGVAQADGFGMTEIGSALSMPPHDLQVIEKKAGSVGMPSLFTEAKIMTPEGSEAATGEVGELWVRGPNVTPGYWNRPEETAKAFEGEWLKTGDSARKDEDGFYYIVDRTKDMYISGGENVYPVEIEAAITELPAVLDCAVIGVPDEKWGEVGAAVILLKEGEDGLEAQAVIDHVRSRLAAYKSPKHVTFVKDLPRTPSGKVQKHKLKEQWLKAHG